MVDRLRGQNVFISGAASGLGAACARRFSAEGANVVIADLDQAAEASDRLVRKIESSGGAASALSCDVTSQEAVFAAVGTAIDSVGEIHCCVTSAGVATHADHAFDTRLLEISAEHWHHVLDVNLTGTLHVARACGAHMIKHGIEGSIITLASFAAKRPSRGVYSVSKAAVWMLTRALAEELGPYRVRVNSIAPGVIDTPMLTDASGGNSEEWKAAQASRITLGRIGQPDDVAGVALFLASAESAYLTGSILHPDGGLASSFAGG